LTVQVLWARPDKKGGTKLAKWTATTRTISFGKSATIDEISQHIVSKLVLSSDFPHMNQYPLATFSAKVRANS